MGKRKNNDTNSSAEKRVKLTDEDKELQESFPGTIAKVTMQNFMCHSNLEFDFGPGINFVVGRNGSGKTAVLNGIMLGLGGQSCDTGGSSNAQGFIQTNKQVATICITLRNIGEDSYLPEVYGDFITIERKLQRKGRGLYKIKNAKGEVISMKKDDLDVILHHFNIQVSNPISILTQNMSKMFLLPRDVNKDVKNKYKFFLNSTQVGILKENLEKMRKMRKLSAASVKTKKDNVSEMEKRNARLRRERKVLDKVKSLTDKLTNLVNEKAWAIIRDCEVNQNKLRSNRQSSKKALDSIRNSINVCEKYIDGCNKDLITFKEEENDLQLEKQQKFNRKTSAVKDYQILGNTLRHLKEVKIKEIKMEMEKAEEKINDMERHINDMSQQNLDEQNMKQENEIDMYEKSKIKNEIALKEAEKKVGEMQSLLFTVKENHDSLEQEYKRLQDMVYRKEQEKFHMDQSLLKQGAQFGAKMSQLLMMIKHSGNYFQRQPIGPIGMYLRIKDPKWAFAVENCLTRRYSHTFCCDNIEDTKVLKNLMSQIYVNAGEQMPTIFTCQFTNKVYSDICSIYPKNFPSIFDIITCTNPVVMNCLIDMKFIDSILLVETSNEAMDVMMNRPPKGCICCYTLKGDSVFPTPNYRYYSCKKKDQNYSWLQQYSQEDVNKVSQEIIQLQGKMRTKSQEIVHVKNKMREIESNWNNEKRNLFKANKTLMNLKQNIENIKQTALSQLDMTTYIDELSQQKDFLISKQVELETLHNEIKRKTMEFEEVKKEKENACIEHSRVNEMWVMLEDKIVSIKQNKTKHENLLETHKASLSTIEKQIGELNLKIQENSEKLKELSKGKRNCRVETNRKVPDLESEIKQTIEAINQVKGGSGAIGFDEILSNEQKVNTLKKQIDAFDKRSKKLKINIDDRSELFINIRSLISVQIDRSFKMNMSSRAFTGTTNFDHEKATLSTKATPENRNSKKRKKGESALSEIQSLSGGERSFVTVSLLLALAEVSEMPFHIFDEYDVFMDDMNKAESMKLMLEKAKEQYGKQFIFLSPLNFPSVTEHYNVKVHQMPDPER